MSATESSATTTRRAEFQQPRSLDAAEMARLLEADLESGLSAQEAARRLAQEGPNELRAAPPLRKSGAREEAAVAIREAHRAGVRVVMITGDHPRTAARMTAVYARVSPKHKLRIVDALQADGHIVAMTGDGVNDAPALKSADIGIAMGVTGTVVTKQAAKMILADDNFATIVDAVREGRGIFDNIRKFLRYLLSSNMGEVLTVFLGVVLAGVIGLTGSGEPVVLPLLATQILWINLVTDSGPALAMGIDPQTDDVMARSRDARRPNALTGPETLVFVRT